MVMISTCCTREVIMIMFVIRARSTREKTMINGYGPYTLYKRSNHDHGYDPYMVMILTREVIKIMVTSLVLCIWIITMIILILG